MYLEIGATCAWRCRQTINPDAVWMGRFGHDAILIDERPLAWRRWSTEQVCVIGDRLTHGALVGVNVWASSADSRAPTVRPLVVAIELPAMAGSAPQGSANSV